MPHTEAKKDFCGFSCSLNSSVLPEMQHIECAGVTWPFASLPGKWAQGTGTMSMVFLVVMPWIINSFVSELGLSCLLPVSMKWWQGKLAWN